MSSWELLVLNIVIIFQAGTEVGCVVVFDTTDGQLIYSTRFDSQESRLQECLV